MQKLQSEKNWRKTLHRGGGAKRNPPGTQMVKLSRYHDSISLIESQLQCGK